MGLEEASDNMYRQMAAAADTRRGTYKAIIDECQAALDEQSAYKENVENIRTTVEQVKNNFIIEGIKENLNTIVNEFSSIASGKKANTLKENAGELLNGECKDVEDQLQHAINAINDNILGPIERNVGKLEAKITEARGLYNTENQNMINYNSCIVKGPWYQPNSANNLY